MGRRGADDAAPLLRLHARHRGTDRVKGRRQVDGDDRVPLLDWELLDRRNVLDAGVRDQDVDRAEGFLRGLDHGGNLGRLRHVRPVVERLDLELLLDAAAGLLDFGGVAKAVERDVGAGFSERAGNGEPDAGGRAGNDGRLAVEHDWLLSVGFPGKLGRFCCIAT